MTAERKKRGFANESHAPISVEWYTPKYIFDALGLKFDLDPCAPPGGGPHVPAARYFTKADDGLVQPWKGRVWCNPPYGRGLERWIEKLAKHGDGIALVMARTDTVWFRRATQVARVVVFLGGRVRFIPGPGSSQAGRPQCGSMLLGFGRTCEQAMVRAGKKLGVVMFVRASASADFVPPHEVVARPTRDSLPTDPCVQRGLFG